MQLYIYAKSGHSFGLENIRRASVLHNMLENSDPILCSADYRAATFAKAELGVKKGVGVDVIGNMPNVMERGDMLIYDDSNEASSTMQTHMKEYCTHLYKVGVDIPFDIVDNTFFEHVETTNEKAIFFADDDYAEWFFKLIQTSNQQNFPLIWGHYFFFKNENKIASYFSEVIEEDGYIDTIKSTKYLLTASVHTCLESLASGNNPVFFQRGDKPVENKDLLTKYNIPTIEKVEDMETLLEKFEKITQNYPKTNPIEKYDISKIKTEIENTIKKFEMIQPSLEYKF